MRSLMLRTAKQFATVGPLVGGALYFVPMVLLDRPWMRPEPTASALIATLVAWVMFSYLLGMLPACLTGLVLGAMRRQRRLSTWVVSAALVGFVVGCLTGAGLDLFHMARSGAFWPVNAVFIGVPSGMSALVCACIFRPIA